MADTDPAPEPDDDWAAGLLRALERAAAEATPAELHEAMQHLLSLGGDAVEQLARTPPPSRRRPRRSDTVTYRVRVDLWAPATAEFVHIYGDDIDPDMFDPSPFDLDEINAALKLTAPATCPRGRGLRGARPRRRVDRQGNREDLTLPMLSLRDTAQRAALLRTYRGDACC